MLIVCAIVAMNPQRVIGVDGALPWHLPEDLKRFSALTRGHTVLMGRKTWDSLPSKFKPLPSRRNVVCSRQPRPLEVPVDVSWVPEADAFISDARREPKQVPSGRLWVIGGEQIYRTTQRYWDEVYLTMVPQQTPGDAYFPEFEQAFDMVAQEAGQGCEFSTWRRKIHHQA